MTELNNHAERAHALLSASSAHRWLACPPSAVAAEAYPDQDTEFTREGTLAHEVAEIYANGDEVDMETATEEIAEQITREMIECAEAYRDYIQEQIKSDDAVVLLEQRVDFSHWVPDGFGTCDCIIIQGDTLTVIDYKYGVGVAVDATDNPQLKLYALGALNDYGFACDVKRVEMHIFQPRIDNISRFETTVADLALWGAKTVRPVAEKAAKGKGTHAPGEHCRFCPHAGRCRSLTKLCTEYVETHSLRVAVPVLAPHEVAEVIKMEPLISLWLRRVKEQALTTLMDGGEIPGFKVVEGKQGNRKWSNELEVAATLGTVYLREEYTKTELLTVAQMEKALGKARVAELVGGLITREPGRPTIAPDTDKRPVFDRTADFDNLDN